MITINTEQLNKYDSVGREIIERLVDKEIEYSLYFLQTLYNDIILPQIIVNDILRTTKKDVFTINVPGLSLKIHVRKNKDIENKDNPANGYMYSKELI